jgi:chaperonin GroES
MSINIKPLGDRVVVKPFEAETKTASGIIIPDSAAEKPLEGEVIAVGNGKVADNGTKIEIEVKVGDKVLYSKYGGTEIKLDGEALIILGSSDLLATI